MATIRIANISDAESIKDIYNYYVINTAITFDLKPWVLEDALHKLEHIAEGSYPFWVCYEGDQLVGYCYLDQWNFRDAYRSTAESTIYLDPNMQGKGYGRLLMEHLLSQIDKTQLHSIIACITIPNDASIALHEKLGFSQVSLLPELGYKLDQWQTVGHWQLLL